MRTTLNLAPEAVAKVRQLAGQRRQTLGAVASDLILLALEPREAPAVRNGMPLLPVETAPDRGKSDRGKPDRDQPDRDRTVPDLGLVNRLRDEEP